MAINSPGPVQCCTKPQVRLSFYCHVYCHFVQRAIVFVHEVLGIVLCFPGLRRCTCYAASYPQPRAGCLTSHHNCSSPPLTTCSSVSVRLPALSRLWPGQRRAALSSLRRAHQWTRLSAWRFPKLCERSRNSATVLSPISVTKIKLDFSISIESILRTRLCHQFRQSTHSNFRSDSEHFLKNQSQNRTLF